MNVTGLITRAELSMGDLSLSSGNYRIEGPEAINLGTIPWRRQIAESNFVHGGFPTSQVKDLSQASVDVQVRGTDQTSLKANIATLLAAFYQYEFQFSASYDSAEYRIRGYAAEPTVGSLDDRWELLRVLVKLVFPRDPTPIVGPI